MINMQSSLPEPLFWLISRDLMRTLTFMNYFYYIPSACDTACIHASQFGFEAQDWQRQYAAACDKLLPMEAQTERMEKPASRGFFIPIE